MKRQALIVVTPNCPKQIRLPGTIQDAQNLESFLLSPEGGAWQPSEITILTDPSLAVLNLQLVLRRNPEIDYALLMFSGHGHYVNLTGGGTDTHIYFSDSDFLSEYAFTLRARRELILMDACREYGGEVVLENMSRSFLTAKAAFVNEDRSARARALFDNALTKCPEGRTTVYACDLNQTASDRSSFSRKLISTAQQMASDEALEKTISIREAFETAERNFTGTNPPQRPVYDGGRRLTHLPFAVSV